MHDERNCTWNLTWWRHHTETFSVLLLLCAGSSPVPSEFLAQRPVTRSFDAFFDLRPNKRLRWGWWFETSSCPSWRHRKSLFLQHHRESEPMSQAPARQGIFQSGVVASIFMFVEINVLWIETSMFSTLNTQQATGLDAWASRVKRPARFVSHLHDICIYMIVYSFLFVLLFVHYCNDTVGDTM